MLPKQGAWKANRQFLVLQHILPAKTYNAAKALALSAGVAFMAVVAVLMVGYVMASPTFGWTGNFPPTDIMTLCFVNQRDQADRQQADNRQTTASTFISKPVIC